MAEQPYEKDLLNPLMKHDTKYRNKFRPSDAATKADQVKKYQFQKGEAGWMRSGKMAVEDPETGEVRWVDNPNKEAVPIDRTAPSLVNRLKAHLRRNPGDMQEIVLALIKEGRLGNMVAIKEIADRVDGKVTETHKVEGDFPVLIQFLPADVMFKESDIIEGEGTEVKELGEGE